MLMSLQKMHLHRNGNQITFWFDPLWKASEVLAVRELDRIVFVLHCVLHYIDLQYASPKTILFSLKGRRMIVRRLIWLVEVILPT